VAIGFFFGACSSAALPSWPPVQLHSSAADNAAATIVACTPSLILIALSNSKGYAAHFF
jgi:hypothetical protein